MTESRTQNIIFFDAMSTVLICFIMLGAVPQPSKAPQKNEIRLTLRKGSQVQCDLSLGVAVLHNDNQIVRERSLIEDGLLIEIGGSVVIDRKAVSGQKALIIYLKPVTYAYDYACLNETYQVEANLGDGKSSSLQLEKANSFISELTDAL